MARRRCTRPAAGTRLPGSTTPGSLRRVSRQAPRRGPARPGTRAGADPSRPAPCRRPALAALAGMGTGRPVIRSRNQVCQNPMCATSSTMVWGPPAMRRAASAASDRRESVRVACGQRAPGASRVGSCRNPNTAPDRHCSDGPIACLGQSDPRRVAWVRVKLAAAVDRPSSLVRASHDGARLTLSADRQVPPRLQAPRRAPIAGEGPSGAIVVGADRRGRPFGSGVTRNRQTLSCVNISIVDTIG